MNKVFTGKVVSINMQDTVVVQVTRLLPHRLYKKLLKRSKKYNVAKAGFELKVGQTVKIVETRPVSKNKYFKVQEIIEKEKHA